MRIIRTVASLLAILFAFTFSADAQDLNRTEHLKSWSEIDFSGTEHIQVESKNDHCLIAEVTNIPGRSRYLIYFNAEFETGRSVVTDHMQQAVNACEQMVRGVIGRSHAVTFFGTDNSVPNQQSANLPLSETASSAQEQSNDYRLAQLRANAGRNLVVSELSDIALQNAGNYVPGKFQTQTVSAPDSLQRLDSLSDQFSLEFRKAFFVMAEIYESGAPDASAFEDRITAMKNDVNRRFKRVHARVDSLGEEHAQTREIAQDAQATAESALAAAKAAQDSATAANETAEEAKSLAKKSLEWLRNNYNGVIIGAGAGRFAGINSFIGEVGLRLGSAEIIAWTGGKSNIGTADLPDRGVTSINRETYGARLNWYPINLFNRIQIGPSIAFEHGEDVLKGREEFIRIYESSQIGFASKIRLTDWLSVHGGARYLTGYKTESSDLKVDSFNQSQFTGSVSINVRLF
jgi:ElaB/YqjD/DUF883 family membrane-anchored ribosome-binding protein